MGERGQRDNSDAERPRRAGYHHGDLRHALIEAAVTLARERGPEAVVLREVARRTGVSPTAAYRHFADHAALLDAVKHRALDELAAAARAALAGAEPGDSFTTAQARLRLLISGYVRFALTEPGLFRIAFDRRESAPAYVGEWQSAAYRMLSAVVDELFAFGQLAPDRRPNIEIAIWAAMHGLATLMVNGHLMRMPDNEREAAVARLTDMVLRGV